MAHKCKCPPAGAPEWMTTYGDMMTLLLCFFVLIVSFSEVKKEEQFQAVVEHIKESFGMQGGGGKIPITDDPTMSLIKRLDALRLKQEKQSNRSNTKDPGQKGREAKVTKIREGMVIGAGGKINFEPGSAELSMPVKQAIRELVASAKLKGTENILELRGHAAALEMPQGGNGVYADVWELSHARARAVYDFMSAVEPQGLGVDSQRFRLTANGIREPLDSRAYTTAEEQLNRRVEVLVSETLVDEMRVPDTGR